MAHIDQDEDDAEWQEWLELPEEQQDAILAREIAEYQRRLDAMTIPQQVAHCRRLALETIMSSRRALRRRPGAFFEDWFRGSIRRSQVRLLKLRIWRATGIYPGATS